MSKQIKEIFSKYPGITNVMIISIDKPNFPNTMIIISDMVKMWIEVGKFKKHNSELLDINIKELRDAGFITGYLDDKTFRKDSKSTEINFEKVIVGSIIRWVGDDQPIRTRNSEIKYHIKEIN